MAIAIQALWLPIDADVSWLITVSERVLGGDRLYVDVLEVNPPASVWLYLPFVWAADLLAVRPEPIVVAMFVAGAFISVSATLRLSSKQPDAPPPFVLAAALSFISLVLPMALFAQREHAALLLAIPALAALALVADGRPLGRRAIVASGLAAGLVIVIKPYFLPAIAIPALGAALKRRSIAPLLLPAAAAAAALCLYAIAIVAFAHAYLDWIPVIAETYAPMRAPMWKVLVGPTLYPAITLGLIILLRPPRIPSLSVAWGLGAAGFLIAAFIQGKNYPNHWLPQAALVLAAAVPVLAMPAIHRSRAALVAPGLAVVALCEMYYWTIRPDPAVAVAIERLAPESPAIISLSPQLTTGHPVTRNVGGRWVGSRAALFTATGAKAAGLESDVAAKAYSADVNAFAEDVLFGKPDLILVHQESKEWLLGEPAIARAMAPYESAETVDETEIWLRRKQAR